MSMRLHHEPDLAALAYVLFFGDVRATLLRVYCCLCKSKSSPQKALFDLQSQQFALNRVALASPKKKIILFLCNQVLYPIKAYKHSVL